VVTQNWPMVVRAKPANGKRPGTKLFYPAASCRGKSISVGQSEAIVFDNTGDSVGWKIMKNRSEEKLIT
jgi:hypothetical protein